MNTDTDNQQPEPCQHPQVILGPPRRCARCGELLPRDEWDDEWVDSIVSKERVKRG